jgi:hypothetical protein
MLTTDYLAAINAPGVNTLGVEWQTEVKPAAAWRTHTLTKVTTAVVMTGVEYRNLAVNSEVETGALPWGEWSQYPYVVTHKGNDYLRVNTVDGTVKTRYFVDGIDVSRDEFLGYLTPSQRQTNRPNGGTLTIKASNMRLVDSPAFALV